MNSVRDIWGEFKEPNLEGLIGNAVALFPNLQGDAVAKEINLSAWESTEAAHKWYVESKGHSSIMRQHTGGYLRTFGNLLASLVPSAPVRMQDRCRVCGRLVESAEIGAPPPSRCDYCGGRCFN